MPCTGRSPADLEVEAFMTHCQVTVSAYSSLTSALADWDAMDPSEAASGLVDAALVEGDVNTIRTFHRHARATNSKGAVAAAIVGVLRPASIVTGAVAGGVGGRMLAVVGRGLTRRDLAQLGDVIDAGPIAFVTLTMAATSAPRRADHSVTVASTIDVDDIHEAAARDGCD